MARHDDSLLLSLGGLSGLLGWSLWGGLLGDLLDGLLWGGFLWGGFLGWGFLGYNIKEGKLI